MWLLFSVEEFLKEIAEGKRNFEDEDDYELDTKKQKVKNILDDIKYVSIW